MGLRDFTWFVIDLEHKKIAVDDGSRDSTRVGTIDGVEDKRVEIVGYLRNMAGKKSIILSTTARTVFSTHGIGEEIVKS